MLKSGVFF